MERQGIVTCIVLLGLIAFVFCYRSYSPLAGLVHSGLFRAPGFVEPSSPYSVDYEGPSMVLPEPEAVEAEQTKSEVPQSGSSLRVVSSSSSVSNAPSVFHRLGIYGSDPSVGIPEPFAAINWSAYGPIKPGESIRASVVYLRNEGDRPVSLYLSSSGWVFRDSSGAVLAKDYEQYFSLGWDYNDSKMSVGEVVPVRFTLTVSPSIRDVSVFSFDLVVTMTD